MFFNLLQSSGNEAHGEITTKQKGASVNKNLSRWVPHVFWTSAEDFLYHIYLYDSPHHLTFCLLTPVKGKLQGRKCPRELHNRLYRSNLEFKKK